jgi:hypothetical protein
MTNLNSLVPTEHHRKWTDTWLRVWLPLDAMGAGGLSLFRRNVRGKGCARPTTSQAFLDVASTWLTHAIASMLQAQRMQSCSLPRAKGISFATSNTQLKTLARPQEVMQ